MDIKQLEYFVRVAELGSFTRASIELDIAQPALSRQVRLLEVELRQNLLVRNGRGAVPTEAGRLLLEHGRGILHQISRARDDLDQLRGGISGQVAVGFPSSVGRVLTVPLTRAFREALPQAKLSISEGLSSALQERLASGRLDIVVLYNAQPSRELDISSLVDEELLLVRAATGGSGKASEPPPVTLQEVAQMALVIPTRPNAIRMHVEAQMADVGLRPNVALEIDGVSAILDLVLDGAGCAILSRNALLHSARPSAYTAQRIGEPPLKITLSIATSLQRTATQVQKAALELIRELAPAVIPH
jgi:LysR family transcriptional regulator, nitrogen assimilation regulatory protein